MNPEERGRARRQLGLPEVTASEILEDLDRRITAALARCDRDEARRLNAEYNAEYNNIPPLDPERGVIVDDYAKVLEVAKRTKATILASLICGRCGHHQVGRVWSTDAGPLYDARRDSPDQTLTAEFKKQQEAGSPLRAVGQTRKKIPAVTLDCRVLVEHQSLPRDERGLLFAFCGNGHGNLDVSVDVIREGLASAPVKNGVRIIVI